MVALSIVIGGILVGLFVFFILREKTRREQAAKKFRDDFSSKRKEVLKKIYTTSKKTGKIAGMPVRVLLLVEKMNMMPKDLKKILTSLEKEKLIHAERDSVSITDFGKDYIEIFMKGS